MAIFAKCDRKYIWGHFIILNKSDTGSRWKLTNERQRIRLLWAWNLASFVLRMKCYKNDE